MTTFDDRERAFETKFALDEELVGADVNNVRLGIGSDQRIGRAFLYPGPGYGGSCFPKDVKALIQTLKEHRVDSGILDSVESLNQSQKRLLLDRIEEREFPARQSDGPAPGADFARVSIVGEPTDLDRRLPRGCAHAAAGWPVFSALNSGPATIVVCTGCRACGASVNRTLRPADVRIRLREDAQVLLECGDEIRNELDGQGAGGVGRRGLGPGLRRRRRL